MPPPPAAWYTFIMMGLTKPSSSLCLASNVLLSQLVIVEPIQSVLHGFLDFVLIVALKFILQFLFLQSVDVWRAATSMNISLPLTS